MPYPKFQDPDNAAVKYEFTDADLPVYPSNNTSKIFVRKFHSRNKLRRAGVLVADYRFTTLGEMVMIFQNVPETTVFNLGGTSMSDFAEMGVFDFYPDKTAGTHYLVEWVDSEQFDPEHHPGGTYSFQLLLREVE